MGISIYPNPYRTPCDNYLCRSMSSWFVGIDGGPMNNTFRLCDPCARHMVEHLPMELMPDGPEKDKKIKQQETKEMLLKMVEQQVQAVKEVFAEPPVVEAPIVQEIIEEKPAEPSAVEVLEAKTTYRCLECSAEFTDKRGLSNHMRGKHKEG